MNIWIEMNCPVHGFERFKIKVIKKFNVQSDAIIPKFRSKPRPGELKCLIVGRNVSKKDLENYVVDYLRRRGYIERVLSINLVK